MAKKVTIEGQDLLAEAKVFSTGSRGYWAGGKVVLDGKRYQVSVNLVEIGSKPAPTPAAAADVAGVRPGKGNGHK